MNFNVFNIPMNFLFYTITFYTLPPGYSALFEIKMHAVLAWMTPHFMHFSLRASFCESCANKSTFSFCLFCQGVLKKLSFLPNSASLKELLYWEFISTEQKNFPCLLDVFDSKMLSDQK